jgi:8-oxo-dGTP pyrophosphatase MutT (NUDIX family)
MSPVTDYRIIFTGCFTDEDIHFEVAPGKRQYKATTRHLINAAWQDARLDPDLQIFNGPVMSLLSIMQSSGNNKGREELFLKVQVTDYKAFYGTNVCNVNRLPATELANPLAVCAVVETIDGTVFTGLRNTKLAETSGLWHMPGGTFNRIAGPLAIMQDELAEELNIAEADINTALCLGFGENLLQHKPEFLCYFHLHLSEQQLAARMLKAKDRDEHTEIAFVPMEELADFILIHPFAPMGKAAVKLYLDYISRR